MQWIKWKNTIGSINIRMGQAKESVNRRKELWNYPTREELRRKVTAYVNFEIPLRTEICKLESHRRRRKGERGRKVL